MFYSEETSDRFSPDFSNQRYDRQKHCFLQGFWASHKSKLCLRALCQVSHGLMSYCVLAFLLVFLPARGALAIYDSEIVGTPGGKGFRSDCGQGAVLAGVGALTNTNRMDAMAAWCVQVDAAGRWLGEPEQVGSFNGKRFRSSEEAVALCPENHAVVGAIGTRGTEGKFVDYAGAVALFCRELTSPFNVTGPRLSLAPLGESDHAPSRQDCFDDFAARGLFGAAGSHVDNFGFMCLEHSDQNNQDRPSVPELLPESPDDDEPRVADAPFLIPAIGGTGGRRFEVDCGVGSVLAGIVTNMNTNRMDAIAPICVDVDAARGVWQAEPEMPEALFGGAFASSQNIISLCPENYAVVGYSGGIGAGNFSDFAGAIQLHCQRLADGFTTEGRIEKLQTYGTQATETITHVCPTGFPVRSLYGAAGSHVDYYGMGCYAPSVPRNFQAWGQWSPVLDWPVIAIHAVLTPQGHVLTYGTNDDGVQGAHFYYDIWNPQTGKHTVLDNTLAVDSFCSAPLIIPETKEIIMPGGDARFGEGFNKGIVDAPILDTEKQEIRPAANMSFARWYPTATTLTNGEIFVAGGIDGAGNVSVTPEIFSPTNNAWRSLFGASDETIFSDRESRWWYPRHWVAPNGQVFGLAGSLSYYIDTAGEGDVSLVKNSGLSARGYTSTAVMYRPGLILQVGGRAANGAVVIDLNQDKPDFREVSPPVAGGREAWANLVVLPDGKVLLTGGGAGENELVGATLTPELWDPQTEEWTALPDFALPRLYHSSSLLLPDGRVLMGGGGAPGPLTNTNAEIFTPGYLLDDAGKAKSRPQILTKLPSLKAGEAFTLGFASELEIVRATLIKSGAVTHSFNMEQRFLELDINIKGETLTAKLPENPHEIPPGYYLLFLIDAEGVPSVAQLVSVAVSIQRGGDASPQEDALADNISEDISEDNTEDNTEHSAEDDPNGGDTQSDSPDNGSFVVAGSIVNTDIVGSAGGRSFSVDCGERNVLVGVTAWTNKSRMDAIAPWCVAVNAQGAWLGEPQQMATYGKRFRSSEAETAVCANGQVMVGFTGGRGTEPKFEDLAGAIAPKCRTLRSSVSASGAVNELAQLGPAAQEMVTTYCPGDAVARGLFGAAGSHVDNYGLHCFVSE